MSNPALEQKIKEVISANLNIEDLSRLQPNASFTEDLGADSIDVVSLVMAFEEEFGVQIPDEDSENITTVQSAIDYITARVEQ